MNAALSDRLQVWGLESDTIIYTDGSLGFVLDLTPLDISCADDSRVNSLVEQARHFLNGLPPYLDLQFMQEICGGNDQIIQDHLALGTADKNQMALKLSKDRSTALTRFDEAGRLPKFRLSLIARKPMATKLLQKPKLFSKVKLLQPIAEERLEQEITEMTRLRDDMLRSLNGMGLKACSLKEEEVIQRLYRVWNPNRPVSLGTYRSDDIRNSVVFTDAVIDPQGFSLGDEQHRIISLKLMPEQTFAGMAASLQELPFNSILTLSIHVPDQQKELESLQTQRRLAFSMVSGKSGTRDLDSEAKFQDLETLLEEMVSQGERVFNVGFNIVLRSFDSDELDAQASQVLMKVRELGGAEAMEESLAAFDIFSSLSFPNARVNERLKRMKTTNLTDFLLLYGPWSGHEKPRVLLRSRMGSLVKFDPFSNDLTNANQLVSGGSGAGKSYLVNTLLLQMLKENPRVFIVDIGGSYIKLTETLGGQYVPFGVGGALSLNPFDLKPGDTGPDDQKIKFLVSLVEIMTKEEGAERLPRLERAEIEQAVKDVYAVQANPRLSHLREILLQHPEPSIKRIGKILGPWCGDTPFGQFVDRPSNISLEKPIVCFDLKGMESYPDLQAVGLFIITDLVWRAVQADRSTMKFTIFDESWQLLENEAGAAFIGNVFRTYRKYYASAIAISQTVDDFARSKVAHAILPNSAVKWILRQRGADKESLKEVLSLNDHEIQAIDSLYQERGKYAEAFLMAGDNRIVVAIESTPLEYWICTTDPRDLSAIEATKKTYPDYSNLEILEHLAQYHPHGIAVTP